MRKAKLNLDQVTIERVRVSDFGCSNCLWYGVECIDSAKYAPALAYDGQATCKAYTYCD